MSTTSQLTSERHTDAAMAFLGYLAKNGRRNDLAAIIPDGPIECASFLSSEQVEMRAWIEKRQGRCNLYCSVNEAKADAAANYRLSKADIGFIYAIYVDLDPKKVKGGDPTGENFRQEQARLRAVVAGIVGCKPSFVVATGGGYQLWWQLKSPLPATQDNIDLVEGIGRCLAERFGGDNTWNVDRLLRLVGTVNLPDKSKQAQGRAAAVALPEPELSSGKQFLIEELALWAPPVPRTAPKSGTTVTDVSVDMSAVEAAEGYEELPDELRQKFEAQWIRDANIKGLWEGTPAPGQTDTSGSGFALALARRIKPSGEFNVTEFGQLLYVWDVQPANSKVDARYISRAWANCGVGEGASGFEPIDIEPRSGPAEPPLAPSAEDPTNFWADDGEPPTLPNDVLPAIVEQTAIDGGRRLGVDPGAVAAASLTALGSMVHIGNMMQMQQRNPKWKVKPTLWTDLVGDPGTNKTGIINEAMAPLAAIDAELQREFKREWRAYQLANARSGKNPKGQSAAGVPVSEAPQLRQRILRDTTTEAAAEVMSCNPAGLIIHADELTGFICSIDAYKARPGKDRAFWLSAKEGGAHTVNRKGALPVIIENCGVSILGGIQPDKIAALAPTLTDDGLLQRFAHIHVRSYGIGEDIPADEHLENALGRMVTRMAQAGEERLYKFEPDADAELRHVQEFSNREASYVGASPALQQFANKLPNEFGRLALVFHFLEYFSEPAEARAELLGEDYPAPLVSAATARRARRYLLEFIYPHAQHFYGVVLGTNAYDKHARWVAGYLLSRRLSQIDGRTVDSAYLALRGPARKSEKQATMQILETQGWLRALNHPTTKWAVNPLVHDGRFRDIAVSERKRREAKRHQIAESVAERQAAKKPKAA